MNFIELEGFPTVNLSNVDYYESYDHSDGITTNITIRFNFEHNVVIWVFYDIDQYEVTADMIRRAWSKR
jgi:hypothetical protein